MKHVSCCSGESKECSEIDIQFVKPFFEQPLIIISIKCDNFTISHCAICVTACRKTNLYGLD